MNSFKMDGLAQVIAKHMNINRNLICPNENNNNNKTHENDDDDDD